jgi:hypothetical protein
MRIRHFFAVLSLFAGLASAPHAARAAQSYSTCTGFITTLPATISAQGVWCLKQDLATAITSGIAITIAANNVTIDCNDFKLGGLAAGTTSSVAGIYAYNLQNATIRHCNVRGFKFGIALYGGGGHLVEDNRLDNNLQVGITTSGVHNRVRRNAVYDTGGFAGGTQSKAISAIGDIEGNIVDGVFTDGQTQVVVGIEAHGNRVRVRNNRIGGLATSSGPVYGIDISPSNADVLVSGNSIVAAASGTGGDGINANSTTFCTDNTVANFSTAISSCQKDGNGEH